MPNQDQKSAYQPVIQGAQGPEVALRPSPALLARLLRPEVADSDRESLARQLADDGYTIDVPIDVWGWDSEKTTSARRTYGYTWVPPATGENPQVAPGLFFPGAVAYNAKRPPLGAILVPAEDGSFVSGASPLAVPPPPAKPLPPPAPKAVFGTRMEDGSWTIGPGDTMPYRAEVAGPDGRQYIRDSRGFWTRYFPLSEPEERGSRQRADGRGRRP